MERRGRFPPACVFPEKLMRFRPHIRPRPSWTLAILSLAMLAIAAVVLRPAAGQEPEQAHVVPASPPQAQPAPPPEQQSPPPQQQPQAEPQPAPPAQQAPAPAPPPEPQPAPPPEPQPVAPSQPAPAPPPQAAPAAPPQQPAPPRQQPQPVPAPKSVPAPPLPAAAPPAAASKAPVPVPPPGPLFGETIEVRVVNVEAVVTDKKGNRVPDLKPEDFRLKVDGKPIDRKS